MPLWADNELSQNLESIIGAGEKQDVEFKSQYPAQASDLAKEIAAFATSNDGTIILGVGDEGEILGLDQCNNQKGRADLVSRIEGICTNIVRPTAFAELSFAIVESKTLLVISVKKGRAPIYYSKFVPYLRQLTAARPMAPDEVVEHVLAWDDNDVDQLDTLENRFLNELVSLLPDIEIVARERRVRKMKPWIEDLRWSADHNASMLHKLSASAPDSLIAIVPLLEEMAVSLEEIAHERSMINAPKAPILQAIDDICEQIEKIRARWLPVEIFGTKTRQEQKDALRATARQLTGLVKRIEADRTKTRIPDVLEKSAQLGLKLLHISSLGVILEDEKKREGIWALGEQLRELETRRRPMDGGRSEQKILDDLVQIDENLQKELDSII